MPTLLARLINGWLLTPAGDADAAKMGSSEGEWSAGHVAHRGQGAVSSGPLTARAPSKALHPPGAHAYTAQVRLNRGVFEHMCTPRSEGHLQIKDRLQNEGLYAQVLFGFGFGRSVCVCGGGDL